MNYRHAFHAGNFADLLKHTLLLELVAALVGEGSPLTVVETHAGAGLYDLGGEAARRTGEAQRGIVRLMDEPAAPAAFARLRAAVAHANGGGPLRLYPGSPLLIARALRESDRYVGCEIRPDDHAALQTALPRGALALKSDGWREGPARVPPPPARALLVIDPPFEAGDDHAKVAAAVRALRRLNSGAAAAIWLPIKDLATYDSVLGALEDAAGGAPMLVAEARLRPLADPMSMNGCAVVVLRPPPGLAQAARDIAGWIVSALGEAGGEARVID